MARETMINKKEEKKVEPEVQVMTTEQLLINQQDLLHQKVDALGNLLVKLCEKVGVKLEDEPEGS